MDKGIVWAILVFGAFQAATLLLFAPPVEELALGFDPESLISVPKLTLPPQTAHAVTAPPPTTVSLPPAKLLWKYAARGSVYGVAVSTGGEYVAAASSDFKLYFLNSTGGLLWSYNAGGTAKDVAMTPDASAIVVTSYLVPDGNLHYLNKTGARIWKRKSSRLPGVDIKSDKTLIVIASEDENVYSFNRSGGNKWTYKTGESAWGAWDVAFSGDGKYVAVGADDKNLYLLNSNGTMLWKNNPSGKSYISGVAVSSGGEYVAAAAQDTHLYVFDRDGNFLWSRQTGSSNYGVAISPDSKYVALGSWDKNLYIFDINGNTVWQTGLGGYVNRVAFSPDGKYLAAGCSDNNVYLYELNLGG